METAWYGVVVVPLRINECRVKREMLDAADCLVQQICSIKFAGGQAHFRSKYVKTTGYVMEKKCQKALFKGSSKGTLMAAG